MSTSSLLKSAQATVKKIQAQQDAVMAFDWQSSAQTYDDFVNYSKYLQDRLTTSTDSSSQLGYATTLRSAQRSYTSNEIQRVAAAAMEGRATTSDKMETVKNLFYQAQANGDSNLSQNLLSQYDSLSVQLQNEQEAAMKQYEAALRSGQAAADKVTKQLISDLKNGAEDITLPNGQVITPLATISDHLAQTGDTVGSMKAAQETLDAIAAVVIDSYKNATSQDQIDSLESTYGPGLRDLYDKIDVKIGGKTLNYQDVVNANAHDELNNPLFGLKATYNEVTGTTEYQLKKNNVSSIDYVRQVDAQGNESYVPLQVRTSRDSLFFGTSDQARDLNTQITDQGSIIGGNEAKFGQSQVGSINAGEGKANRNDSQTIGNRLKELGIVPKQNGTTLTIRLPGESIDRTATIQPDGSVRYFTNDGQIAEIGLVDRNLGTNDLPQIFKAGQSRVVSPEELSDFGTPSAFGGRLSAPSAQGTRYVSDILGKTPAPAALTTNKIQIGNNFSGYGSPITSELLQSASQTRQTIQLQQQREAMLQAQSQALQSTSNFNLNQVPVQQLTSSGILKKQLQVAAPAPTPRVVVAPPAPTPQITSVSVAQPGKISGVSVAAPSPRLVVR